MDDEDRGVVQGAGGAPAAVIDAMEVTGPGAEEEEGEDKMSSTGAEGELPDDCMTDSEWEDDDDDDIGAEDLGSDPDEVAMYRDLRRLMRLMSSVFPDAPEFRP